ncbi:hypothetical protein [Aestuariivivens insulae]|uniref:hypothetical protein n=1 Tax=Aestuariivivens insulae TaxID=1621988 RepID=UPI001F593215|nr:hypothetical protein [Aestuariivivens insulae]
MKTFKALVWSLIIGASLSVYAQEPEAVDKKPVDKKTYYQNRAAEDAKFEQQFEAESKAEEEAFWEEQKYYEKDLKKRDKKAYRAYMKGKRDAYAEHYEHCDHHCHHGYYYYHHASFYYYGYHDYYYERYPRRRSVTVGARINTPRVSLGLL